MTRKTLRTVDYCLLVAFLVTAVTGIILYICYLRKIYSTALVYNLHTYLGLAMTVLALIHFIPRLRVLFPRRKK